MPPTSAVLTDVPPARRLLAASAGVLALALATPSPAPAQTAPAPTAAAPAQPASPPQAAPPAQPRAQAQAQAVDPTVVQRLERMGGYLRDLKVFELTARTSNDVVLEDGTMVNFDGRNTYKVRAPSGLYVDVDTDRKQREFYFDGKTLTVYAPRQKYYAQVPAVGTNRELIDKLEDDLGMVMPLADLFYWGTPDSGFALLQSAQYIGYAKVDGVDTDQYAFRQPGADWQLWIDRGDRPLPRKLLIAHTDQPERPQYEARLEWRLRPTFTADAFTFSPPADAKPIQIIPIGADVEGAAP